MVPSRLSRRLGLAALSLALGLGGAGPALAGPRDQGPAREIHITVRARRIVIPPPLIEQVGEGQARIQFPASGRGKAVAFTMARVDGRFVVTGLEALD